MPPNFQIFRPPRVVAPDEASKEQEVSESIAIPDVTLRGDEGDNTVGDGPAQLNTVSFDNTLSKDTAADASGSTPVVTNDNGSSVSNPNKAVEDQPLEVTGNQPSNQAQPSGKKAKRSQEDANVQWLGDKVR
jgi:hypothetical protein